MRRVQRIGVGGGRVGHVEQAQPRLHGREHHARDAENGRAHRIGIDHRQHHQPRHRLVAAQPVAATTWPAARKPSTGSSSSTRRASTSGTRRSSVSAASRRRCGGSRLALFRAGPRRSHRLPGASPLGARARQGQDGAAHRAADRPLHRAARSAPPARGATPHPAARRVPRDRWPSCCSQLQQQRHAAHRVQCRRRLGATRGSGSGRRRAGLRRPGCSARRWSPIGAAGAAAAAARCRRGGRLAHSAMACSVAMNWARFCGSCSTSSACRACSGVVRLRGRAAPARQPRGRARRGRPGSAGRQHRQGSEHERLRSVNKVAGMRLDCRGWAAGGRRAI